MNESQSSPQDPTPIRVEFRVVLDGVQLDERQTQTVALTVQRATLEALAAEVVLETPLMIGYTNFRLSPEWVGFLVRDGIRAQELAARLEAIGVLRP